ncbi:MAG TPA: ABC transporter permease [Pirellulaceae bacterium]|nr:ABC transporter permease [Pirellulaceae bacterium]HMO91229.1 ABC transporter permease [Pirellulaceae bacterium]HMP68587.1 ABC transporter permease [Pirellulaceae bacterium]
MHDLDSRPIKVIQFTPQSALRSPVQLFGDILQNVRDGWALAWRMFLRNLKGQYRQTFLGLFWVFLPPLANTALWVLLASRGVTNFAETIGAKYTIYVLTGMVLWQAFIDGLLAPLNSIQSNRSMLSKLRFPRESILMVGALEVLFDLAVRTLVLIPLLLWFGMTYSNWLFVVPVAALALVCLSIGLGCLMMPWGMLYQDIGKLLTVATPLWMILTQIVYPPPQDWASNPLNWANPASPLLLWARDILVVGQSDHLWAAIVYATLAVPIFIAGLVVYRVAIPVLVERVSN